MLKDEFIPLFNFRPHAAARQDSKSLSSFLRDAETRLESEWEKQKYPSQGFTGVNTVGAAIRDQSSSQSSHFVSLEPTPVHELQVPDYVLSKYGYGNIICTAWSSQGNLVAGSLGPEKNLYESSFKGVVVVWQIASDSAPKFLGYADTQSGCITCLKFHPQLGTLLAGGTFFGEIVLLNLVGGSWPKEFKDDNSPVYEMLMQSPFNDFGHISFVSEVEWIHVPTTRTWQLASSGFDGRFLIWDPLNSSNQLKKPIYGTIIKLSNVFRSRRAFRLASEGVSLDEPVGISSFCAVSGNAAEFLLGTCAGQVFRISKERMTTADQLSRANSQHLRRQTDECNSNWGMTDAITMTYQTDEPGPNAINSISVSPFISNLFISCSEAGDIYLFKLNQAAPIKILHPQKNASALSRTLWSPTKPTVYLAAGIDGSVSLYDWERDSDLPVTSFQCSRASFNSGDGKELLQSSLFVSASSSTSLAIFAIEAKLYIWKMALSCNFMQTTNGDLSTLF